MWFDEHSPARHAQSRKQAHEQSDNTVFFEIMTALEVVMLATSVLIAFATICATATYAACWVSNGISGRDYW
jgi:hypothetical protein